MAYYFHLLFGSTQRFLCFFICLFQLMLSIQERQVLLQRYLDKIGETYTRKRLSKEDCLKLIDKKTDDVKTMKTVLSLLRYEDSEEWVHLLYVGGYPVPCYVRKDLNIQEKDRKANVLKRYLIWKDLRPHLENQYHPLAYLMLPYYKHSIFDFHSCHDPRTATLHLFRLIFNYIPLYSIYMYDPVPGTGYKYYSGERLILYYITEDVLKDHSKSQRLVTALTQKSGNGYPLTSKFQVVITTVNWHGLKDWPHITLNDDSDTFKESLLIAWKNCTTCKEVFLRYNHYSYVLKNNIYPWPYAFKNVSQVYALLNKR